MILNYKQEGLEGPGSLTWEIGQKVTVEPLCTPEEQFENKGHINLNILYTITNEIFVYNYFKTEPGILFKCVLCFNTMY
jgi:hypothetical protein